MRYDVVTENGASGLVISAQEKYWGPGYLQFGMTSSNNLEGDSTFNLGAIFTQTGINSLNGEWRTGVQLGEEPALFTEIYQPLDPLSRYFVSGKVGYRNDVVSVFDDSGEKLAEVRLSDGSGGTRSGARLRHMGRGQGRVSVGLAANGEIMTGTPAPDFDVARGEVFARLSVDTFDSLYFPRRGQFGVLEWRTAREGLGANVDYEQVAVRLRLRPFLG